MIWAGETLQLLGGGAFVLRKRGRGDVLIKKSKDFPKGETADLETTRLDNRNSGGLTHEKTVFWWGEEETFGPTSREFNLGI